MPAIASPKHDHLLGPWVLREAALERVWPDLDLWDSFGGAAFKWGRSDLQEGRVLSVRHHRGPWWRLLRATHPDEAGVTIVWLYDYVGTAEDDHEGHRSSMDAVVGAFRHAAGVSTVWPMQRDLVEAALELHALAQTGARSAARKRALMRRIGQLQNPEYSDVMSHAYAGGLPGLGKRRS